MHVIPIDTAQRCTGCGETIQPGGMHRVVRTDVGKIETFFYHAEHCPTCGESGDRHMTAAHQQQLREAEQK